MAPTCKSKYKPKFKESEKVLCYHGPLLYDAKCIRSEIKNGVLKYFVHYAGWNRNWDEWVVEERIVKYEKENIEKQKDLLTENILNKKHALPARTRKAGSAKPKKSKQIEEPPKPKVVKTIEAQSIWLPDSFLRSASIKIDMPEKLRDWLQDDNELVNVQKKLVQLPCKFTVKMIIDSFYESRIVGKNTLKKHYIYSEFCNTLCHFFELTLGSQLLYKFERIQFLDITSKNKDKKPMIDLYGASHLLRMFNKIETMLPNINMSEDTLKELIEHIQEFLRYLASARDIFNLYDYGIATPEYYRRAIYQ